MVSRRTSILLGLWLLAAGPACAQELSIQRDFEHGESAAPFSSDELEPYEEPKDPIHKFGRGVTNVLTCWIELPTQMLPSDDDAFAAHTTARPGLGSRMWAGFRNTGIRLGLGLTEAVTFLVPYPTKGYDSPYPAVGLRDYAWDN